MWGLAHTHTLGLLGQPWKHSHLNFFGGTLLEIEQHGHPRDHFHPFFTSMILVFDYFRSVLYFLLSSCSLFWGDG